MTTCSVEGCDRKVLARGLCHNHYQQARNQRIRASIVHPPCAFCGGVIDGSKNKNATYCSIPCKQKAIDKRRSDELRANREAKARRCGWCLVPLDGDKRTGARFCSRKCLDDHSNHVKAVMAESAKRSARQPCATCGEPVPAGRRHGTVYCSPECKSFSRRTVSPAARLAARDMNLVQKYGITLAERDAMLVAQGGECAICGAVESVGKGWHIDHDHASSRVRGVLCHHCNLMLGNACDDPARLRAAATYLEAHASV